MLHPENATGKLTGVDGGVDGRIHQGEFIRPKRSCGMRRRGCWWMWGPPGDEMASGQATGDTPGGQEPRQPVLTLETPAEDSDKRARHGWKLNGGAGSSSVYSAKSLSENWKGSCGWGFWSWPRRRGLSIPAAVCEARANAGHDQKTRRPEGSRGNGQLTSLLLAHRPLRVCSLVAPRHPAVSSGTGPLRIFRQALKWGSPMGSRLII